MAGATVSQMRRRCLVVICLVLVVISITLVLDSTSHRTRSAETITRTTTGCPASSIQQQQQLQSPNSGENILTNVSCPHTRVVKDDIIPSLWNVLLTRRSSNQGGGTVHKAILPSSLHSSTGSESKVSPQVIDISPEDERLSLGAEVRRSEISCDKLALDDYWQKLKAKVFHAKHSKVVLNATDYISSLSNCTTFREEKGYLSQPVSPEEEEFPLAFSILIFKEFEQFERLLRAIYRPQNYYCIHVDKKSSTDFHLAARKLADCFTNVFISAQSYDVQWGMFSIVEPELACMKELLKYKKWKYFINLTGQEFPLKTNWQIVEILKIFNGANNLEGTVARRNKDRTHPTRPQPPVNVTLTKGSVHITASRAFIEYIINDQRSISFREWVKDTYVSDETYFSSLNHSPQLQVPGSYLGTPETDTKKNLFITRFKNWGDGPFDWPCGGQRVRQVCVFGLLDLPLLYTRSELFANKFYIDFEPLTFHCVEKKLHNSVRSELESKQTFINRRFYSELDFVKNHLKIISMPLTENSGVPLRTS